MLPVLFSFGPVKLYSFGLMMVLAFLVSAYWVWKSTRGSSLGEERVLDAAVLTILGGLAGARILFVLSNPQIFMEDLWQALAVFKGGLSFWGAIIGGMVVLAIIARRYRYPVMQFLDLAAPATAIGASIGYIGAFLGGSSYGAVTGLSWGVEMVGLTGKRHPSQLLEALLQVVILVVLLRLRKTQPFSGFLALSYLGIYSFGRFVLELLRGDRTQMWGPFSQAQVICLVVFIISFGLIYLNVARLQGRWGVNFARVLRR
jgi:phosphatidylglycerol---prolipoprotein diacylglyceryl transferase